MLDAALDLARRGWVIGPLHESIGSICSCREGIRCTSKGKHPRTRHGFKDFSREPDQIKAWWRRWPHANIGGATEASGVVVIDLDLPRRPDDLPPPELAEQGARDGIDAFTLLVQQAGHAWPEPRVHQSWSGAQHLIFRAPEGVVIPSSTSTRGLTWKADVKARGGQIVLPPSEIDGHAYTQRAGEGVPQEVRPLPVWLIERLRERPRPPWKAAAPQPVRLEGARAYLAKVLDGELTAIESCTSGRNDQLAHSAFVLGQFVGSGLLDRDQVHDLITEAAAKADVSPHEAKAQNTIRRCIEAGSLHPRTIPERRP